MKITFQYDFLSELGGIERVMAMHALWLEHYQPSLSFITINEKTKNDFVRNYALPKSIPINKVSCLPSFFGDLKIIFNFLNLFPRKINSDLIISHGFFSSFFCYKLKKLYGQKYSIFIHHPPNFLYLTSKNEKKEFADSPKRKIAILVGSLFNSPLKKLDKIVVKNAERIFVNSEYTKKRVRHIYGNDALICYPTFGVNFKIKNKKYTHYLFRKFNIPEKFILCHGRIIPDKRVDLVIKAICHLKDYLVISGQISKEMRIKLLNVIHNLNVHDKVSILGRIEEKDLICLYNEAEVFVLSAPKEDFGLTPLEAMACGTPCVAWADNAGPSETIIPGVNGFLVLPYDTKDLANKILLAKSLKKNRKLISDSVKRFSELQAKNKFLDYLHIK